MKITKKKLIISTIFICLFLGISFFVYYFFIPSKPLECDEIVETPQSNQPESFETMLAGVRHAVIQTDYKHNTDNSYNRLHLNLALGALKEYLIEMGFESAEYSDNYNDRKNRKSCEEILVLYPTLSHNRDQFYDISMRFVNNAGHFWDFSTEKIVKIDNNAKENFKQALRDMYGSRKVDFDSTFVVHPAKKQTCWTEKTLKNLMQKKGCDELRKCKKERKSHKI